MSDLTKSTMNLCNLKVEMIFVNKNQELTYVTKTRTNKILKCFSKKEN